MDIKIHSDFSNANLEEMKEVFCSVGWPKQPNEIIKQIFEASNVLQMKFLTLQSMML